MIRKMTSLFVALSSVMLVGCPSLWAQPPQGTIKLPHPTIEGAMMEFSGDSMMIGIAAVEYVKTLNQPARQQQAENVDDCARHEFSAGAAECERRLANRELLEYGGGGAKSEPVPLTVAALQAETAKYISDNEFWASIFGGGLDLLGNVGVQYIGQKYATKRAVASEKTWQKALEELGGAGGTSFGEVFANGPITFQQADDGGIAVGGDGSQTGTGAPIIVGGDKGDISDSDASQGGFPVTECGGPGEICVNNDDQDDVSSEASLL